ncbi:MAG: hypothetical protein AAGG50_02110 [Bacteroidota bacterium]
MTRGIVTAYDAKKGIGFVQRNEDADRIPFSSRVLLGPVPNIGDRVEYAVIGGKVGCRASVVRPIR